MKATKILIAAIFSIAFVNLSVFGQTKTKSSNLGYADASYSGLNDNEFLKNWHVLGPVKIDSASSKPDDTGQKGFFDKDPLISLVVKTNKALPAVKIGNTEYTWKLIMSDEGTIDFIKFFGQIDYAVAYAIAEIKMEAPAKILIGLGSDDGVKLFLNGVLIHSNWIGRGTTPDDDLVVLDLKKGSNQVLLKVQNMEYAWSFTMRKLGKNVLNDLLIASSGRGNLDNIKLLLEYGADVNASNDLGLTAYQSAMIRGREKAMDYLKEKGAKTDVAMPSFDKLVSNIFKNAQTGTTPGVAVLVSKNGEIIYQNGFGYADVGNKVPATPDTKFRIGSVTKQFVASAILKLQEEGKLSVQDKLSKYIPDFPRGDEVTIHHLLTHTSGIHSFTNRPSFGKYLTLPITTKAVIDTIKAYPYDFNPGDKYLYNNSGFFILGYIVEKISGKSLGDYLQETFFKPLGMNNTGIYQTNQLLDNEAYGYSYQDGKVIKAVNWDMSWAGGAGAMYSTTKDLFTWNEAVFNGKVLSDASLKAAFTPVLLNNKEKIDYGYGWSFQEIRGVKFISHGGGLNGFLTYLGRQPESKANVIVFCNSTPPPDGINPSSNASLIAEYLLYSDMVKQLSYDSNISIDESILKSYTGRYNYGQGRVLIVTLEGKQLYAQMTGQSRFPIFPATKDEFVWKVVDAKAKFVSDENGNVTHIIHQQNGQKINAPKLKEETQVNIDPAQFDKLIGKYDMGNNLIITITKESDKLMAQGANLPKFQLLPASETEYFIREMNARLKFKLEGEGKAPSLVVVIDGVENPANRLAD
ncbi:MAG TPA: serine hydrolase [Bacteroidales bacterium]